VAQGARSAMNYMPKGNLLTIIRVIVPNVEKINVLIVVKQ
jgi:hypothetical protein